MPNRTPFRRTITLTFTRSGGAGTEFQSQEVSGGSGILHGVMIRRDAGDTITTSVDPAWVTNDNPLTSAPPDDDVVHDTTMAVTLVASATTASLDTDLTTPRQFDGLRLGGDFTLSGNGTSTTHWTIWGDSY